MDYDGRRRSVRRILLWRALKITRGAGPWPAESRAAPSARPSSGKSAIRLLARRHPLRADCRQSPSRPSQAAATIGGTQFGAHVKSEPNVIRALGSETAGQDACPTERGDPGRQARRPVKLRRRLRILSRVAVGRDGQRTVERERGWRWKRLRMRFEERRARADAS